MSSKNLVRKSSKANVKKTTKNREAIFEFARTIWAYDPISTLKKILKFEYAQKFLMDFLKTEYADQTLEFYLEIQRLTKLDENDKERETIKLYQSLKATKERNISADMAMRSLQAECDKTIKMLAEDSFPRFLKSPFSSKLLSSIEARGTEEALKICDSLNSENHTALDVEDWLLPFIAITNSFTICITIANMTVTGAPLVFLNQQFTNLTGYSIEEVRGYNCRFLQGPETEGAAIMILRESLSRGQDCHVKLTNYKKTGETFQNSLSLKPVYDSEGVYRLVVGVQLVILDEDESKLITQRLNLIDKLLRLLPNKISVRTKMGRLKSTLSMRTSSRAEMIPRIKTEIQLPPNATSSEENKVEESEPAAPRILKVKSFSKKNVLEADGITNTNTSSTSKPKRSSLPTRKNSVRSMQNVKPIDIYSSLKNMRETNQVVNDEANIEDNGKSDDELSVEPFDEDKVALTELEQKELKVRNSHPVVLPSTNDIVNNEDFGQDNEAGENSSTNDKSYKYRSQTIAGTTITSSINTITAPPASVPRGIPRPNYKPATSFIRPMGNMPATAHAPLPYTASNNNNSETNKIQLPLPLLSGGESRRSTLPLIPTGVTSPSRKPPRSRSSSNLDGLAVVDDLIPQNKEDVGDGDSVVTPTTRLTEGQYNSPTSSYKEHINTNSPTKPVMPYPSYNTGNKLKTNHVIISTQPQQPQRSSSNEDYSPGKRNSMTTTVVETMESASVSFPSPTPVFILPESLRRATPVTPQPMKYLPEYFQLSPPIEVSPLRESVVQSPLRNRLHTLSSSSNTTTSSITLSVNSSNQPTGTYTSSAMTANNSNNPSLSYHQPVSYTSNDQDLPDNMAITNDVEGEVEQNDDTNYRQAEPTFNNTNININTNNNYTPAKMDGQDSFQSSMSKGVRVISKVPVRSSQLLKRSESGRGKSAGAFSLAGAAAANRFKMLPKQEDILTEEGEEEEEENDDGDDGDDNDDYDI